MSHPALAPTDRALVAALASSSRGPARDGAFALWLVARACLGPALGAGASDRHREHLLAVGARVRTLSIAAPLRRAIAAALADLAADHAAAPAAVLGRLLAPATDSGLTAAASALQALVRTARPAAAEPER
jgi:hypothetical protein